MISLASILPRRRNPKCLLLALVLLTFTGAVVYFRGNDRLELLNNLAGKDHAMPTERVAERAIVAAPSKEAMEALERQRRKEKLDTEKTEVRLLYKEADALKELAVQKSKILLNDLQKFRANIARSQNDNNPAPEPVQVPVNPPAEVPANPPAEVPANPPAEVPANPPADVPVNAPAEVPANPPAEVPANPPIEVPANPSVEVPANPPAEVPANSPVDVPVNPPAKAVETAPVKPQVEVPPNPQREVQGARMIKTDWSAFPCSRLDPVNYCAEIARRKAAQALCQKDSCDEEINNSTFVKLHKLTEQDLKLVSTASIEEIITKGVGIEKFATPSGTIVHRENGFMLVSSLTKDPIKDLGWDTSDQTLLAANVHDPMTYRTPPTEELYTPRVQPFGFSSLEDTTEVYVPFVPEEFFESGPPPKAIEEKDRKIILWYSPTRFQALNKTGLHKMRTCPEFPCFVTKDRHYAAKSAAMLFAAQLMPPSPPPRRPDQIFVFHNHEPPEFEWVTGEHSPMKGVFNWTMTYRLDSDVIRPYGLLRPKFGAAKDIGVPFAERLRNPPEHYATIMSKKTRMAAALVSHCDAKSGRDQYIKELSKHIQVDVFGECGPNKCPRQEDVKCFKRFSTEYKFFLAFENTHCEDYITEKFFRYYNADLLTVVMGANQYHMHAPKGTFINTADFKTPKDLADKLLELDKDMGQYVQMLQAKDQFYGVYENWPIYKRGLLYYNHYDYETASMCQLCQKLWNVERYAKVIPDVAKWFGKKLCK